MTQKVTITDRAARTDRLQRRFYPPGWSWSKAGPQHVFRYIIFITLPLGPGKLIHCNNKDSYKLGRSLLIFSGPTTTRPGNRMVRCELGTPFLVSGSPQETRLFISGCVGSTESEKGNWLLAEGNMRHTHTTQRWPSPPKGQLRLRRK